MLVLSRKVGERFLVGDDVWITVVEVGLGKVRVGINAPADVEIAREELLPACQQYPNTRRGDARAEEDPQPVRR